MTIKAAKFTPEVMLAAPRRSSGVPNSDGSRVLFTLSTYSFSDHKSKSEVKQLKADSNESYLVTDAELTGEPNWIDDELVLVLGAGKNGSTNVVIGDPDRFTETQYTAGNIDGAASGLRLQKIGAGTYIFAVAVLAQPNGDMYNSAKAPKKNTTGMIYDSLFVRHWDSWITPNRNALWYGKLTNTGGKYRLSTIRNALHGSRLECPIPPFGGAGDYALGPLGLAFVAKDPDLDPATHTKQNLYICGWEATTDDRYAALNKPFEFPIRGFEGAAAHPTFSSSGLKLAFTIMKEDGYEADQNQVFLIEWNSRDAMPKPSFFQTVAAERWDRSPGSLVFSNDDKTLYAVAEDLGNTSLYRIALGNEHPSAEKVFGGGTIGDVRPLRNGKLFISGSNFIDNSVYFTIDPSGSLGAPEIISSNSKFGSAFGLSENQIDDIWFKGAKQDIHAWVIKPSNFTAGEKYPLAYVIHGGPQSAWNNGWSTRWNPAVFAEQGYVVICPNPTGSTGYGQALTDGIQRQWGGLPYQDLVCGFDYIESELDYVDTTRAVALGASYGGYMINWIQGHDLGRKFKALVTHDGVFSMTGQLASEELYFPNREFGGTYMSDPSSWLEWDPAAHTQNWKTPHLIIHSDKDYRLTISEGLSAFNVLQQKGIPSRFLAFPDENHWVLKAENGLLWHSVVIQWINHWAGLPSYPIEGWAKELLDQAQMT